MFRLISSASVAALTALAASCAPVSDGAAPGDIAAVRPEHQCFRPDQVRNFRQGGTAQLFLRVNRDEVFELNTGGGCMDVDFAQQLAITPDGAGIVGSRICTGDWTRITLPRSTPGNETCRARVERRLTAEEVAALPRAHTP